MVEVDYPHGDSTWPDTQDVIERAWGHLPWTICASSPTRTPPRLYRWPLPDQVLP